MKQRDGALYYLLIPLILCAGLRIMLFGFHGRDPAFSVLILDAFRFQGRALEILDGRVLTGRPFDMVPLYPFFLAAVYKMAGVSLAAVRVIQLLCGLCSGMLIYLIGRRVFSRTAGLTAFLLYALCGVFPYFELHLLATSLSVFMLLLFTYGVLAAMEKGKAAPWTAAGLAGGILVLLRPNFLPVMGCVLLFLLYLVMTGRRRPAPGISAGHLVLFGAPLGACLAASLLFNVLSSGEGVLLTAHSGINFYIGNNPGADGTYVGVRGIGGSPVDQVSDAAALAEEALGRELSAAEVSSYWSGRALAFIKDRPLAAIKLYLRKFAIFWNAYEVPSIADFHQGMKHLPRLCGGAVRFGLISPFAFLGLLTLWKGRGRAAAFLYVLFLSYLAVLMLFYVNGRYRLPIVPILILFAAAFLQWLYEAAKAKRWRIAVLFTAGAIVLFVLVHLNLPGLDKRVYEARGAARLGMVFISNQQYDRAVSALDEALRLDPGYYKAYLDRGTAQFLRGHAAESRDDFQQALALNGDSWEAWQGLGNIGLVEGRLGEAEESYLKAIEKGGRTETLLVSLFQVYRKGGRPDRAVPLLEELTARFPENETYVLDLADLYERTDSPDRALDLLARREAPGSEVLKRLARLYAAGGRFGEAEALLRDLQRAHPDDPEIYFRLGVICHRRGRLDEALAHYQRALEGRPEDPLYHLNIGNVHAARGELALSEKAFREALKLQPGMAQAEANLREILRRRSAE
jgi:Flp pilus assembly protein TadD/4-amino-4-deoxy-L-arabinose transferase-like glycosyltransferase